MAILPSSLEFSLKDPNAGPRPISIEEYKKRVAASAPSQKDNESSSSKDTPSQQPQQPIKKKTRGGKLVKIRQELGNLHRLMVIADKNHKKVFQQQIQKLKKERKEHQKFAKFEKSRRS